MCFACVLVMNISFSIVLHKLHEATWGKSLFLSQDVPTFSFLPVREAAAKRPVCGAQVHPIKIFKQKQWRTGLLFIPWESKHTKHKFWGRLETTAWKIVTSFSRGRRGATAYIYCCRRREPAGFDNHIPKKEEEEEGWRGVGWGVWTRSRQDPRSEPKIRQKRSVLHYRRSAQVQKCMKTFFLFG